MDHLFWFIFHPNIIMFREDENSLCVTYSCITLYDSKSLLLFILLQYLQCSIMTFSMVVETLEQCFTWMMNIQCLIYGKMSHTQVGAPQCIEIMFLKRPFSFYKESDTIISLLMPSIIKVMLHSQHHITTMCSLQR